MTRTGVRLALWLILLGLLASCVENPVTGAREFGFIGTGDEIAIGSQHYAPTVQSQGGTYQLEPALMSYVAGVTHRLAAVSDRPLPYEMVVINSSVPNAWALPGGKMAINRGLLLELENEAELAAVIGHEIVHAAARHGARAMERGLLLEGAVLAAAIASGDSGYAPFVVGGAQLGAALISLGYSREAEREADLYGMHMMHRAGYDPAAAIGLQETFVRLAGERRSNWLTGLFASHPPSMERVANNRATAERLGANGELGRERYQQAIAELRGRQDAFAAADAARGALAKRDFATTERKLKEAIEREPREASFHGLLGDLRMAQNRPTEAETAYSQALARDESYFAHWQGRGLARLKQSQRASARNDLERGVGLLPTAVAMNALGQLDLAAGRTAQARQYLGMAATSAGPAAEEARRTLARLDVPAEPERFLTSRWAADDAGRLILEVTNRAPIAVHGVVVEVQLRREDGRITRRRVNVPGTLAAGAGTRFHSGLTLPADTPPAAVASRVIAARPVP
ncbi:MAG: peptidase M48 [Gammaproteobacteria bacterium]|nr:MAG: peptidase M48 [Gammaproteobacteria bacterium]